MKYENRHTDNLCRRSLPKQGGNEIVMHKPPSANDVPNTLRNLNKRWRYMATNYGVLRQHVPALQMNVWCYGTRILFLREFSCIRVSFCQKISLYGGLTSGIEINVNEELNSQLWRPVTSPVRQPDSMGHHGSLKRKAMTEQSPQPQPLSTPQHHSPVSNSPETSEPTTPPAMAPPVPKRTKVSQTHTASYIPTTSCKYPFSFLLYYFKRTMVLDWFLN